MTKSEFNLIRFAIFVLNFAVSAFVVILCIVESVEYDPVPNLICSVPFTIYALCEWIAVYRKDRVIERRLGWANLAFAAFVGFGLVTNVGEALMFDPDLDVIFLAWFALIGTTLVTYLAFSGWMRLRWTRKELDT
ncbi:MAG: hypothetical protein COA78_35405 [Blastopirellula sp.]|nr:MAG: hypothetical protein COA78_35405 [Blastopirellula sp.]